jgi:hypothetical protein
MPETKKITCRMDYDYAAKFLASLPSYCEVTIEWLMARDRPAEGRRFTNLTSGTEWFITGESLQNITATNIIVHPFTIACTY